jgi:hypothetical protein
MTLDVNDLDLNYSNSLQNNDDMAEKTDSFFSSLNYALINEEMIGGELWDC